VVGIKRERIGEKYRGREPMRNALKWSGIGVAPGTAVWLMYRVTEALRVRLDRGLAHAERVTKEARAAVERTHEALAHAERAIQGARQTVS